MLCQWALLDRTEDVMLALLYHSGLVHREALMHPSLSPSLSTAASSTKAMRSLCLAFFSSLAGVRPQCPQAIYMFSEVIRPQTHVSQLVNLLQKSPSDFLEAPPTGQVLEDSLPYPKAGWERDSEKSNHSPQRNQFLIVRKILTLVSDLCRPAEVLILGSSFTIVNPCRREELQNIYQIF